MNVAAAQIQHATPQRTRLTVDADQRDQASVQALCERLGACAGVAAVRVNPTTGSIVVNHPLGLPAPLASLLGEATTLRQAPAPQSLAKSANRQFQAKLAQIDHTLRDLSGGSLDFASVAGGALVGMGLWQIRRGMFMPAGLTLLVLAYRLANGKIIKEADAPSIT